MFSAQRTQKRCQQLYRRWRLSCKSLRYLPPFLKLRLHGPLVRKMVVSGNTLIQMLSPSDLIMCRIQLLAHRVSVAHLPMDAEIIHMPGSCPIRQREAAATANIFWALLKSYKEHKQFLIIFLLQVQTGLVGFFALGTPKHVLVCFALGTGKRPRACYQGCKGFP